MVSRYFVDPVVRRSFTLRAKGLEILPCFSLVEPQVGDLKLGAQVATQPVIWHDRVSARIGFLSGRESGQTTLL